MAAPVAKMQSRFTIGHAIVKLSSMPQAMAERVVAAAEAATSKCMGETEIASHIRQQLSLEWPDCTWQVLVGRNFGSYVSFEESRYIYFYVAQVRPRGEGSAGGLGARTPRPPPIHTFTVLAV